MRFFRPAYTLIWYVLREFLVSFALSSMAVTMFFLLVVSFAKASELEQFGVDGTQVLMLAPFFLPRVLTNSLPPATMIAVIMVFGRLSAESEILAAQAGGAALRRFVWPLLVCSVLISLGSLWLHDAGMRWGNDTIRTQVLKLHKPDSFLKSLDKPGGTMSIHPDASKYTRINVLPWYLDKDGNQMRPIELIDFVNSKIMQTVLAENHQFNVGGGKNSSSDHMLSISLSNVQTYSDNINRASEIALQIPVPDIAALIPIGNSRSEKGWRENLESARKIGRDEHRRWAFLLRRASEFGALAAASAPLDSTAPAFASNTWNDTKLSVDGIIGQGGALDRMRQDYIEFHRKIALSILPFSMVFLGVGLGLLVKKSNRMIGFLLGLVLYALLYFPLVIVAKALSSSGTWDKMFKFLPPQYLPNIFFLVFGYFLWRMYERGFHFGSGPVGERSILSVPAAIGSAVVGAVVAVFKFVVLDVCWGVIRVLHWILGKIANLPVNLLFFRRTTDMYIGSSFLTPFLIVVVCIAGLVTAFDVIEHMGDVIDGIRHAAEPMGSLPIRTQPEAIRDMFAYYGIQALEFTLDYLPLWVLIAGMLCAMVLVRNQEHLILKSSGIKLQRALRPTIILALLVCGSVTVIREMWMPELILHRDFLKPQVYHRNSQPSSLGLYMIDENKKPLLFEMGSYNFATKQGRDMHVYLLSEQKNGRIPQLVADVAKWNADRQGWDLYMDPAVQELKLLEQAAGPFGGGAKDKVADKEKEAKHKKEVATEKPKDLILGGQRRDTDNTYDVSKESTVNGATVHATATHISRVDFWQGPLNPKYIDSERLGLKVMRLNDLKKLSEYKPELMAEWYRRVSEFAMGFVLLWCALPLMLSDSAHSPVTSIAFGTVLAAVYWCLCIAAAKLGADATTFTLFAHVIKVPIWAPIIPHAMFFLVGFVQFYFRLET